MRRKGTAMIFREYDLKPLQEECARINDKLSLTFVSPIVAMWVTPDEATDLELDGRKGPWVRLTDGHWDELVPFVGAVEALRDFAQSIADRIDDEETDTREIDVEEPWNRGKGKHS